MERILSETTILERESKVQARLEKLRLETADLEAEMLKISAAKELFGLYGGSKPTSSAGTKQDGDAETEIIRPDGIPTTREMILWAVRDVNRNGSGPTQQEIFEAIRRKWWPEAPANRLRPMLWSLWKEKGVLTRRKERYYAEGVE